MSPEEQNFYYFKLHDLNNDNYLDGLEVIGSFDHTHEEENGQNNTQTERMADADLTKLVDEILNEEDLNHDGFISYEEYQMALAREALIPSP